MKRLEIRIQLLCHGNKEQLIDKGLYYNVNLWNRFNCYSRRVCQLDGYASLEATIEGQLGEYRNIN